MERPFKVRISASADTTGYRQATQAANDFTNAIKAGIGIDLGGRIVTQLAQLPNIFQAAIAEGVKFNSTLESAKLGVAAIIKSFDVTGTKTFDQSLVESEKAVDKLKKKANETSASFEQLVESFQSTSGAASAANISLNDQVGLLVTVSNAVAGLGVSQQQLSQEYKALLTGNILPEDRIAKALRITGDDIEKQKEAGTLLEFLQKKLEAFGEAGKRGQSTLKTAFSNLGDAITQMEGKMSKPVFEALREGILNLAKSLDDPQVVESLRAIGIEVGNLIRTGAGLVQWAVRNADTLALVARSAQALGVAFTAMKISQIVTGLGAKAVNWMRVVPAIEAETAALARNTAAQTANNTVKAGGQAMGAGGAAGGTRIMGSVNAGIAIGMVANQAIEAYAAHIEAATQKSGELVESQTKQINALKQQIREASTVQEKAAAQKELEEAIVDIQKQLTGLHGQDADVAQSTLAVYQAMQQHLEDLYDTQEKMAGAARNVKSEEASRKIIAEATWQLMEAIGEGNQAEVERLQHRVALEKEIHDLRQQNPDLTKKDAEDLAARRVGSQERVAAREKSDREAEAYLQLQNAGQVMPETKLRNELADLQAKASDPHAKDDAASWYQLLAAIKNKQAEITEEIKRQEEQSVETMQKDEEERISRNKSLDELHLERDILTAKVKGQNELAEKLQRELDLRHNIESLMGKGLTEGEATAEAKKTMELQRQLDLKGKLEKKAEADAQLKVDIAKAGGNKREIRDAELEQFKLQTRDKLKAAGFEGKNLDDRVAAATKAEERRQLRAGGRFGGDAARSQQDLKDQQSRDSFFNRKGSLGPMLPVSGNPLAADGKSNLPSVAPGAGIAPQVDGIQQGADSLKQVQSVNDQLGTALGNLAGAVSDLAAKVDNSQLVAQVQALQSQVDSLSAQVDRSK